MAAARRDRRRVLAVTSVLVINAKFNFRALLLLLIFDVLKQPLFTTEKLLAGVFIQILQL